MYDLLLLSDLDSHTEQCDKYPGRTEENIDRGSGSIEKGRTRLSIITSSNFFNIFEIKINIC